MNDLELAFKKLLEELALVKQEGYGEVVLKVSVSKHELVTFNITKTTSTMFSKIDDPNKKSYSSK